MSWVSTWVHNNPWLRTAAPLVAGALGGPLTGYATSLLTREGGGLNTLVHDPLYQGAAGLLAGGLAGGAMGGAAGAAGTSGGASHMNILDTLGGVFKDGSGKWDWGKIGSTASGAIGAFNKSRQTTADINNQRAILQLQRDRLAMDDREFAAKYGMDKSNAQLHIDEFNRTQGTNEGMLASGLQHNVDMAPLRDRASALLQARMSGAGAPVAFNPRDITRGTNDLSRTDVGGPAATMPAMQAAAAAYTPGSGGVTTDVQKALIARFLHPTPVAYHDPGTYTAGGGYQPAPPVTTPPSAQPNAAMTPEEVALEQWRRRVAGATTAGQTPPSFTDYTGTN